MSKKDEIMDLINQLSEIPEKKHDAVKNQTYEIAANIRDEERRLLEKLDEVSGVHNFYNKVYNTEKILSHLEIITNSTEELKKLRPNFNEVFEDMDFNKILVNIYKQRDEAYEAVLEIRKLIK